VQALINVFERQGKIVLAEFMFQKQEAIVAQIHGTEALCVAACLLRRAEMLTKAGRKEQAEPIYQKVLNIYQKAYGLDSGPVNSLARKLLQLYPLSLESHPESNGATDQ